MAPSIRWHAIRLVVAESEIHEYFLLKGRVKELKARVDLAQADSNVDVGVPTGVRGTKGDKKLPPPQDLEEIRKSSVTEGANLDFLVKTIDERKLKAERYFKELKDKYLLLVEVGDIFALKKLQLWNLIGDENDKLILFEVGFSVKPSDLRLMEVIAEEILGQNCLGKRTLFCLSAHSAQKATEEQYKNVHYPHSYSRAEEDDGDSLVNSQVSWNLSREFMIQSQISWHLLRECMIQYHICKRNFLELKRESLTLELRFEGSAEPALCNEYYRACERSPHAEGECVGRRKSIISLLRNASGIEGQWICVRDTYDLNAIWRIRSWSNRKYLFEVGSVPGSVPQVVVDLGLAKWGASLRARTLYYMADNGIREASEIDCARVGYPYSPGSTGICLHPPT